MSFYYAGAVPGSWLGHRSLGKAWDTNDLDRAFVPGSVQHEPKWSTRTTDATFGSAAGMSILAVGSGGPGQEPDSVRAAGAADRYGRSGLDGRHGRAGFGQDRLQPLLRVGVPYRAVEEQA